MFKLPPLPTLISIREKLVELAAILTFSFIMVGAFAVAMKFWGWLLHIPMFGG